LTASGTVQDITAVVRGHSPAPEISRRDTETGELLAILGLADQLNKPIPPPAEEREAEA
jgi:hypothetical protein